MWSMILLLSHLPGGHSMSAGWRLEKLGYQQSTLDSLLVGTARRMVLTERSDGDWVGDTCESAEHIKESFGSARVVFRFRKTNCRRELQ